MTMTFWAGLAIGYVVGCALMVATAAMWFKAEISERAKPDDKHIVKIRTQCSVCGRVIAAGADRRNPRSWKPSARLLHDISHGYCPECAKEEMAKIRRAA